MRNQSLSSQLTRLKNLISKVDIACSTDIEMRAHWAKYICVLCSGFLENAVSEIYGDFVKNAASQPVANYAVHILAKTQNPRAEKFIDISRSFKNEWAINLEGYMEINGRKDAINAIISNRHNIAHGENSTISLIQIKSYFEKAIEVIEYIEEQCNT